MTNLAGKSDCDKTIERELIRCGIVPVHGERSPGEVPSSITGRLDTPQLGSFEFSRAWYYYVVKGLVPLAVARELYADPVGREDVRVAGHCGCSAPEDPWLKYLAEDGREVLPVEQRSQCEALAAASEVFRRIWEKDKDKVVFDDDRSKYPAFVDMYHIDSEIGLRLFAHTVKAAGAKGRERER